MPRSTTSTLSCPIDSACSNSCIVLGTCLHPGCASGLCSCDRPCDVLQVAKPSSQASGDSSNADSLSSGDVPPSEASQTHPTAVNDSLAGYSTRAPDLPTDAASAAGASATPAVRFADASAVSTTSAGGTGAVEDSATPTAAAASVPGGSGGVGERPGGGGGSAAQSTVRDRYCTCRKQCSCPSSRTCHSVNRFKQLTL